MSAQHTISILRTAITAFLADEQRGCSSAHLDLLLKKLIEPHAELTRLRAVNERFAEFLKELNPGARAVIDGKEVKSSIALKCDDLLTAHEAAKGRP